MRPAWFVALMVGLTAVMTGPSGAEAQRRRQPRQQAEQGPSAEARERAREAYARGQEAFRAGEFEASVAAFREAYEAVPNPVVLLGLAEAQERGGDVPGAIETLERYLAERTDAPDAAQVEERIAGLRARPATVVITSTPAGAVITVDGDPQEQVTPAEIEVPPGEHVVALTLQDYEPASETVEVAPGGRQEVELTLEPGAEPRLDEDPFGDETEGGAPPPEPPDVEQDEPSLSAGVWVAAGVSGAALVGGTVLGFLALSEQSDFDTTPTEESADRGERLALFADVAFGVAAIAGITAIVLYLTGGSEAEPEEPDVASVDLLPVLSPGGGGLAAQGRF